MVKAAAKQGLVDEHGIVMENMYAFARAGADIIITYHARDIVENGWL
jgi:porphobilinogen synthase